MLIQLYQYTLSGKPLEGSIIPFQLDLADKKHCSAVNISCSCCKTIFSKEWVHKQPETKAKAAKLSESASFLKKYVCDYTTL